MSCDGCSNAVNRVLTRLDGVNKVEISLENQKVLVDASPEVPYQTIYDKIAKTGKPIHYGKEVA